MNKLIGSHTVPDLGLVTTSVAHSTDAAIVERSWGLLSQTPGRKDEFYGKNFSWVEYMTPKSFLSGIALHFGVVVGVAIIAMLPPLRWLLHRLVYQPGQGPERESTYKHSIEYRGVATPDMRNDNNKRAFVKGVFSGGSMYYRKQIHPSCFQLLLCAFVAYD